MCFQIWIRSLAWRFRNFSTKMASTDEDLGQVISLDRIKEYCEIKRENPVSIKLIHEIIGGPNIPYVCCNDKQSEFVYKTVRDNLSDIGDDSGFNLKYSKEKNSPLINAIFMVVNVPKTATRRQHMVLMGCVQMQFQEVYPKVGYARKYHIVGMCFLLPFIHK